MTETPKMPARSAEDLVHELQVHQIELEMQNEALRQMQAALEASRDRYANLYEYAPVGYLAISADGMVTEINLTGVGLLGTERQNLLHRHFSCFVAPADREYWASWFGRMKQQVSGQSIELDLQRDDGLIFHARLESRTMLLDDHLPLMRMTVSDISERKRAEIASRHFADQVDKERSAAALQESEALLQEAQKVAALGHWTYLLESGAVSWSPQLYRLFERDPAQQATDLGSLIDSYSPESARQLKDSIAWVIRTGKRLELELQLELSGERLAHHALALIPRCDEQGKTVSLYGTIQDITEHKLTEVKLLRLAEQLVDAANEAADLYENAPCGYHSVDKNGIFCLINDTELQRLGYAHDELVGKKKITDLLSPSSLEAFNAVWPDFLKSGVRHDLETEFVRKDGTILPVLLSATAIRDANGDFQMSRASVYDMTERRKMELERADYAHRMTELSRHLVAVQEAARRQLSGELHDRTSPNLAAIDINFGLIARELPARGFPELAARLEDIRALIQDTAASIHEICADLRPPVLDYAGLPAALDAYAHRFTGRTGIQVRASYSNPARRLAPDIESLLFRIAQESLCNCARHAHATSIDLLLDNDDSPIVLSIADDGAGFLLESLLNQGDAGGVGILNMREMAEFAGGKFRIETLPGKGTRVWVEIP